MIAAKTVTAALLGYVLGGAIAHGQLAEVGILLSALFMILVYWPTEEDDDDDKPKA